MAKWPSSCRLPLSRGTQASSMHCVCDPADIAYRRMSFAGAGASACQSLSPLQRRHFRKHRHTKRRMAPWGANMASLPAVSMRYDTACLSERSDRAGAWRPSLEPSAGACARPASLKEPAVARRHFRRRRHTIIPLSTTSNRPEAHSVRPVQHFAKPTLTAS